MSILNKIMKETESRHKNLTTDRELHMNHLTDKGFTLAHRGDNSENRMEYTYLHPDGHRATVNVYGVELHHATGGYLGLIHNHKFLQHTMRTHFNL